MVSYLTYDYTMFIGARRMQRPPIQNFDAPQTAEQFDFTQYDYIVDAIDTVTGKLELIEQAQKAGSCLRNDPANSAHMPMGIPIYFTIVTSLCSTSR